MITSILLSIVCFYILGLALQILLLNPKKIIFLSLGEIFGLGFAGAGLVMMICSLLLIKFSSNIFILSTFIFFILIFLWRKPLIKISHINKLTLWDWLFITLIIIFMIDIFLKTFSYPIWGCDAYTIWLARGRAFFIDKAINIENLKRFWPSEHPPLWSMVIGWSYVFFLEPNEVLIRYLPLLFYFLIIFEFITNLKINKIVKYIVILILITLPQLTANVVDFSLAGNADLFLSFYFFMGILAIYKKQFTKAGLFFALGSWVKSDGTPAVLIFIFFMIIFNFKNKLKPIIYAILPVIVLFAAKYWLGISSRYFQHLYERPYGDYLWYDLMAFREEMRKISNWSGLWWLFTFILIVKRKFIFQKKEVLFCYLMILFQIISYVLIFLITPENQAGHIASAIYRLLLHVAPAALFITAAQLGF